MPFFSFVSFNSKQRSSGTVSPQPSPHNDYQGLQDKPPIPPRGMPPPVPVRQLSYETAAPAQTSTPTNVNSVTLRNRNNSAESMDSSTYGNSPVQHQHQQQQQRPYSVQVGPTAYNGDNENDEWRRGEHRSSGEFI